MKNIKATEKTIKAILKRVAPSRLGLSQAYREDNDIICTDGRILFNEKSELQSIPKGFFKLEKGTFYDANTSLEGCPFPKGWRQVIPTSENRKSFSMTISFDGEGFTSFVFLVFRYGKMNIDYLEIIYSHFKNSGINEIVFEFKDKEDPFVFHGNDFKFVLMPMKQY